jgi:hypothetical protein
MQKFMFSLSLGVICLLATSCVPESENPLSDVKIAAADPALYGLWSVTHDNGDVQYLHIGAAPQNGDAAQPDGWMQMCFLTHRAETKELALPFAPRFFTTRIGDASYANLLIEPQDEQSKPKHWFYKYAAEGNRLMVWIMDWQETARVIEARQLDGTVARDGKGRLEKVLITSSAEKLQRFLREGGDRMLFPDTAKAAYTRVRG